MPTRLQVLIPISLAAIIIGVVGIISIPSDAKLEAVDFPIGTIKIDDQVLQVQIADTEPRTRTSPEGSGVFLWFAKL